MIHLVFAAAVAAASASASTSASAAPAAPTALPAGHPQVNARQQQQQANFFRPPPDSADEEAGLAPGTIKVEVRDALNKVVPNRSIELGIVQQSIAKGDSHKHVTQTTGADGMTTFSGLEFGSGFAYRVVTRSDGATFAARPFNLGHEKGMHVVLHVYPVVHELPQTLQVGSRAIMYVEVKDDRIQIQERIDVFNGAPAAWVPNDLVLRLPENFTALTSQQQMSDIGVDAVAKEGARLHGTFLPGENMVGFSWQIPYGNEPSVDFEVGMPPAARQVLIRAAAAPGMKLEVPGFREAVSQVSEEGQRELVTMKPPARHVSWAPRSPRSAWSRASGSRRNESARLPRRRRPSATASASSTRSPSSNAPTRAATWARRPTSAPAESSWTSSRTSSRPPSDRGAVANLRVRLLTRTAPSCG
jgi:hypothetical protein